MGPEETACVEACARCALPLHRLLDAPIRGLAATARFAWAPNPQG
jgi:hypothetical protein